MHKLTIHSIILWTLLFCPYANASGQSLKKDSTVIIVSQDSSRLNKIDSATKTIGIGLERLQEKAESIQETVKKIDDNTNDSYFTEAVKNYSFSLIYELLGYKSETSANGISKIVSLLSLIFLGVRIYFYINKNDKHQVLKRFLNFYLIILAFIALMLPWMSSVFPNKEVDKTQILRITENAKKLNDEIEKIESADFGRLKESIAEVQALRLDTIPFAREKSLSIVNDKMNHFQIQLISIGEKLDSLNNYKCPDQNLNVASHKQQNTQTWFIVLTFIMMLVVFGYFLSQQPWKT